MSVAPDSSTRAGMRLSGAILVLSSLCCPSVEASDGPPPGNSGSSRTTKDGMDDSSKDHARFRGIWMCTRLEMNGKEMPGNAQDPAQNPYWKVVFDDDIFRFVAENGKPSDPIYKVRWTASTSPKQIDLDGIPREETLAGIYKLDGDILTICLTIDKDTPVRPTRFTTKEGLPLMLFVFQRERRRASPRDPDCIDPAFEESSRTRGIFERKNLRGQTATMVTVHAIESIQRF
jgi:uncharacterized protein (TIGR03067 family)